jgi:hypothetical protein
MPPPASRIVPIVQLKFIRMQGIIMRLVGAVLAVLALLATPTLAARRLSFKGTASAETIEGTNSWRL